MALMHLLATLALMGGMRTVEARPTGAPSSACLTMQPGNITGGHGNNEQEFPAPYGVASNQLTFAPGGSVTVQVQSYDLPFKGLLLQARIAGTDIVTGWFDAPDPLTDTKAVTCNNPNAVDYIRINNTITHSINTTKTNLTFVWNSDGNECNDVDFLLSIVRVRPIWWHKINTLTVRCRIPTTTTTAQSSTSGGGNSTTTRGSGASSLVTATVHAWLLLLLLPLSAAFVWVTGRSYSNALF